MSGAGGSIIKYDAATGTRLWSYVDIYEDDYRKMSDLHNLNVSADGERIAAYTSFAGEAENGIDYLDSGSEPAWRSGDHIKEYPDLSPDRNPAPNGFEPQFEEEYTGFYGVGYDGVKLPDGMGDLRMSADGEVMLLRGISDYYNDDTDAPGGHLFLFSRHSPYPFQVFAENDQPENDSRFQYAELSDDGAWVAGVSMQQFDARLTLHLFEVPSGIIVDVQTPVTLSVSGTAGEALSYLSDVDEAGIQYDVIKPGRAADISVELNHTSLTDELLGASLSLPWEDTHRSRLLEWGAGFQAETVTLDWETPISLTNSVLLLNVIVLRGELYSDTDVLLSQSYDDYLQLNIISGN